jgi:hypothetical protein
MSALVTLSGRLPGDPDINGLDAIAADLVANPEQLRVVVAWIDVSKVTTSTDTGDRVPTVRVRRIEPVGTPESVPAAFSRAVLQAAERRTGMAPLPFGEVESDNATADNTSIDYDEDER